MTFETAAQAFARLLRLKLGTRASAVASEQRDAAQGDSRRSWEAIVEALAGSTGAPLS